MHRLRLTAPALLVLGAVLVPLTPQRAHAAITGNVAGVVTDQATHKPLAGVTVTVSGPRPAGRTDRVHRRLRPLHRHRAPARRIRRPLLLRQHQGRTPRRLPQRRQDAPGQRRHPHPEGLHPDLPHRREGPHGGRGQHPGPDPDHLRARAQHPLWPQLQRRPHPRPRRRPGRRRHLLRRRHRPREQLPHRRRQHHEPLLRPHRHQLQPRVRQGDRDHHRRATTPSTAAPRAAS